MEELLVVLKLSEVCRFSYQFNCFSCMDTTIISNEEVIKKLPNPIDYQTSGLALDHSNYYISSEEAPIGDFSHDGNSFSKLKMVSAVHKNYGFSFHYEQID